MPMPSRISIKHLPQQSETYIRADFVELLALVNQDREISKADVLDRVSEQRDIDAELDDAQHFTGLAPAERNDKEYQRINDWFVHLRYREATYKEYYPFALSETGEVLQVKEAMTYEQMLYAFLLFTSHLNYMTVRSDVNVLTSAFELVSMEALKSLLPAQAEVHVFGKGSSTTGRYKGRKWDKIQKLAEDIRETVTAKEDNFSPRDTGDSGLDLVAWVPIGDSEGGILLAFGQCACTLDWVDKQSSSSTGTWQRIMTFTSLPTNVVFIPFCFRRSDGTWPQSHKIQSVLIDRIRFVYLLREKCHLLEAQLSSEIMRALLQERESLV